MLNTQKIGVYNFNNPLVNNNNEIIKGINNVLIQFAPKLKEKCEEAILNKLEPIMNKSKTTLQNLRHQIFSLTEKCTNQNTEEELIKLWKEEVHSLDKEIRLAELNQIEAGNETRKVVDFFKLDIPAQIEEITNLIEGLNELKFLDFNLDWDNIQNYFNKLKELIGIKWSELNEILSKRTDSNMSSTKDKIATCGNILATLTFKVSTKINMKKEEHMLLLNKEISQIPNFFQGKKKKF